jgi:hypothetical protein
MNDVVSPKYLMNLISLIAKEIEAIYTDLEKIRFYLEKWHKDDEANFHSIYNFNYYLDFNGNIKLNPTLNYMDVDLLLKIAIDLGIETPDFIPSIPVFRNEIKAEYKTASATFEKALKQIEEHPDISIGLVNSTLESIIKEILKDDRINSKIKETKTLYDLTSEILKVFQLFPESKLPEEIKTIGSSLLATCKGIEALRSNSTTVHGKTDSDYIVDNPIYAYFIVNSVTTVGLFMNSFYKNMFPKKI